MSPSRPFILRPVATSLLMVAIVLAGLVGFRFLPLSALPQVDYPTIQVQTLYPGASPEVMGNTVTAPLERQFGQMAGLERMSSTSAAGVSIITLQFTLGQTLDVAEQEVQAAINAGGSLLPADLPAPPVYAKVNPADAPVLTLAISSDTMPLTEVQNLVNTRLAQKISQVSGVGLVTLAGGQRPAVRIQADTQALAQWGIGIDTLRTAIAAANANSAKGSFDGPKRSYSINANDQLLTADDYKKLIVTYKNGAPVRLVDVAEQEVQAAINAGGSLLPADLPAPPVYAKVNPADAPVLTLAISSETVPLTEVQNLVNTRLAQKISQVSGVGLVSLSGGQRPAVRIQADTQALASYGIGLDTLRTAITAANANSAKGSFDGPRRAYTINANDQLLTADDYRNLIVAYKNGAPVRMVNVARVVQSAENTRLGAWAGSHGELRPAIILNVQRQPGANVIATVDAIKARLPELQRALPASVEVEVLADRTNGIRASVEHVEMELLLAVVMVVLVIFAFLRDLRATVIASIAVPISLIGTCGAMYLLGYSINTSA